MWFVSDGEIYGQFCNKILMHTTSYHFARQKVRWICTFTYASVLTNLTVGMGKTIMLAALIHTNKEPDPGGEEDSSRVRQVRLDNAFRPVRADKRKQPKFGSSATLIVAPTSLLSQWSEELQRASAPGTLRVTVWHGQNRLDLEALHSDGENDRSIPVVLTSYGVLASEHSKFQKAPNQSSIFQGWFN